MLPYGITWEQWVLITGHNQYLCTWYWISTLQSRCAQPGLKQGNAHSRHCGKHGYTRQLNPASRRSEKRSVTIRKSNSRCLMSNRCRYRPPSLSTAVCIYIAVLCAKMSGCVGVTRIFYWPISTEVALGWTRINNYIYTNGLDVITL